MEQNSFFTRHPQVMRALLEAYVPATAELDDDAVVEVLARSDELIASKPSTVRRQLALALGVLRVLAAVRHLRGLTRLSVDQRRAFLEALQESRLLKLRLAVWGFRTLLFAGYYADPERQGDFGYHPHADGWSALNQGTGHGAG